MFEVKALSCGYGSRKVVDKISFSLKAGEILCLLGPNGAGKTTLFKTVLQFLPALEGQVLFDGQDIRNWSNKKRAQVLAYVPQAHTPPFPFKVLDVVLMGKASGLGLFSAPSAEDREYAAELLDLLKISHLKDRIYTEISGGERQMVLIARALIQNPQILILDEPTSNLDFGNQIRVLEQVNALAEQGKAIIMTTHFPNHVFLCSTSVALMTPKQRFLLGGIDEVLNEENLEEAYGIPVRIADLNFSDGLKLKTCVPLMNSGKALGERLPLLHR